MFLNIVLTFPCPQSKRLEADMTVHLIDTSEVLSCQSWSTPGSSFSLTSHLTFLATRKLVSILQPASIDIKVPVLCCVNFNNYYYLTIIISITLTYTNFIYRITRISKMVQPLLPLTFLLCLGIFSFCFIAVIIKEFFIDREK